MFPGAMAPKPSLGDGTVLVGRSAFVKWARSSNVVDLRKQGSITPLFVSVYFYLRLAKFRCRHLIIIHRIPDRFGLFGGF
jgi:hypothetical protein